MEEVLLATAGEDVRIWTMPNLNMHAVKNGTNANVTSCCCSPNGQLVAYTHEEGGINVASLVDEAVPIVTIKTTCEQSCISFNGNSKYLITGGGDNAVSLWDIKTANLKKVYKDHKDPVTFCMFNYNDSTIASGSEKGDIILTVAQTGVTSDPLSTGDSQAIRRLCYSYFSRSLLASITDSGEVSLWDTKEKVLLKTFTEHKAAGTGVSFSPLNDMLLCSGGLDRKIVFYDVTVKKTVKTINTEGPVTCCEFMHDGCTVAAGSASGRIYLFDLRRGSTPTKVVPGHKTSVRAVSFQKKPKETKHLSRMSQETAESAPYNVTVTSSAITPNHDSYNRENSSAALHSLLDKNQMAKTDDLFSPIPLDHDTNKKTSVYRQKSTPKTNTIKSKGPKITVDETPRPTYSRSKSSFSKFSALTKSTEDLLSTNKKSKDKQEAKEEKEAIDGRKGLLGFKSPFKKKSNNKHSDESETSSIDSFSFEKPRAKKERVSARSNDSARSATSGDLHAAKSAEAVQLIAEIDNVGRREEVVQSDNEGSFQLDFIRAMIDDAMEESRIAVHDDMVTLQVEMLRQMQMQKEQIRQMLQQYSINEELMQEIQALRAENERLKARY